MQARPRLSAYRSTIIALSMTLLVSACGPADSGPVTVVDLSPEDQALLHRVWVEEDSRPAMAEAVTLREGMASETALVRRHAVRGMGRLEDTDALEALAPMLSDNDPWVRATAANAIAQTVFNETSPEAAELLIGAMGAETDPVVRGAIGQALGRLSPPSPEFLANTEALLVEQTRDAPVDGLFLTMRGIEWLARANRPEVSFTPETVERLVDLTRYGRSGAEGYIEASDDGSVPTVEQLREAAQIRRLALAALGAAGALDAGAVETSLYDPDIEVRRVAANAAGSVDDATQMPILLSIAMADDHSAVRYEGYRWYTRRLQATEGCGALVEALSDPGLHIQLLAIDALGQTCGDADELGVTTTLLALAEGTPRLDSAAAAAGPRDSEPAPQAMPMDDTTMDHAGGDDHEHLDATTTWHHGAHALVSLARIDPESAAALIPRFALHPVWQVRMYAANAAGIVGAETALQTFAGDPHANVASAGLRSLARLDSSAVSDAAIAALDRSDYQLLMTAAGALESSNNDGAVAALVAALQNVTSEQRETSRDPRMAILDRIGELGAEGDAEALRPYVNDFDPRVAERAAEILSSWTGESVVAATEPLPSTPFPSMEELIELSETQAVVELGIGSFAMRLRPFAAPTNVARFARQVREGYFEGLTFHRVVPNFVVQGGSPGANEYVGAGAYSRDEVGVRSHLRGTVGISTRGRDTGDSQLFVNLVDNIRLDHNYTVIGVVTEGMVMIDQALEGERIERITFEPINSAQE